MVNQTFECSFCRSPYNLLISVGLVLLGLMHVRCQAPNIGSSVGAPNFIVIFTDDQGYGDLGCYGSANIRTPAIDSMANEGLRATNFYVASPVCTPSRAALMTGCYPKRIGLHQHVLFPDSAKGLNPLEVTLPEVLRDGGYKTACIGKWHLGHHEAFLPRQQGFDYFFGIPYSNDMSKKEQQIMGNTKYRFLLPVLENNLEIESEPDQRQFTRRFTEKAVEFIRKNKAERFFLYLAHPMPHIPLYASESFEGSSRRGLYGDVIEEIDWSVGQILSTLKELQLEQNTIVLFASDNGPWLPFKINGGSAGPLRGGKGSVWEGGMRVPCVLYGPGHLHRNGVSMEVMTAMDIAPTFAALAGLQWPTETKIDGRDLSDYLTGKGTWETEYQRPFYYYTKKGDLGAVRSGPWKLHLGTQELYHLGRDVGEKWNLAEQEPQRVADLQLIAQNFDAELEATARPVGRIK